MRPPITTVRRLGHPMTSTFACLAALGFLGTWGRTFIDGSLDRLFECLHTGLLPGSDSTPLRTLLTGIYWPVDFLLDVLIVFFWEAVDGSHPTTSLLAIYFLGQHLSIVTVMYVNSHRIEYPKSWKMSATLWLLVFQLTGIATTGPLFAALYLASRACNGKGEASTRIPTVAFNLEAISCLPLSITIGYILPSILMQLPSPALVSSGSQQLWIAVWNVFPLLIVLAHKFFMAIIPHIDALAGKESETRPTFPKEVRATYGLSLLLSTSVHIACLTLCITSILFPMLLAPGYALDFSPRKILVPATSFATVDSMGQGVQSFLQWDQLVGYSTMLVVASKYYLSTRTGMEPKFNLVDIVKVFGGCVLFGPGSVVLAVHWAADESEFIKGAAS